MNNAPTHPFGSLKNDDDKMTCFFFPANVIPLIQPVNQGILYIMKRGYRKGLIERLRLSNDATGTCSKTF